MTDEQPTDQLDWTPPRFSMDIEAPSGIRKHEILSVRGETASITKATTGTRQLTLKGKTTTVTVTISPELAARLKAVL